MLVCSFPLPFELSLCWFLSFPLLFHSAGFYLFICHLRCHSAGLIFSFTIWAATLLVWSFPLYHLSCYSAGLIFSSIPFELLLCRFELFLYPRCHSAGLIFSSTIWDAAGLIFSSTIWDVTLLVWSFPLPFELPLCWFDLFLYHLRCHSASLMFSSVGCSGRRSRKTKEKKPQTFQRPSNLESTVQLNKMGTQLYAC